MVKIDKINENTYDVCGNVVEIVNFEYNKEGVRIEYRINGSDEVISHNYIFYDIINNAEMKIMLCILVDIRFLTQFNMFKTKSDLIDYIECDDINSTVLNVMASKNIRYLEKLGRYAKPINIKPDEILKTTIKLEEEE